MNLGGSGLAALAGAAAPGIAAAGQNYQQTTQAQTTADSMLGGTNAAASAAQDSINGASAMQDPNHPVWGFLNSIVGNGSNGGSTPNQAIPTDPLAQAQMAKLNQQPAIAGEPSGGTTGYQNGGVVRLNSGSPTIRPAFTKGPALPTGPNNTVTGPPTARGGMLGMANGGVVPGSMGQGITPAPTEGIAAYAHGGMVGATHMGHHVGITDPSTEGQIGTLPVLKMDAGGVVPSGFIEQQGISGVPMNGRGAAFIEGMQAGQNIGHNLQQSWQNNRAHNAAADYAGQMGAADVDSNPTGASPAAAPSALDQAKDAVEGFFKHIHDYTLGDNHKANNDTSQQALPAPGAAGPGAAPSGAAPAPSPMSPGATPAPQPSGGPGGNATPAPAASPQASAAPSAPGTAAQGQPSGGPPQNAQANPQVNPAQAALAANPVLQNVVGQVANNPQVKAGIPDPTPAQDGKPHSLTPEYWAELNQKKIAAVQAAARAGEDPAKVYESLTAMQNAHFQGQVLKQAATAAQAFQNGNMDAVTQALKNINYYLPNGQDIDVRKATAADAAASKGTIQVGDLVHSNPYQGMYGHENDPPLQKVDLNYIQSLGQGALDPAKMQAAQQSMYAAQMNARKENYIAEGALLTGTGKNKIGQADLENADTRRSLLDVDRRLRIAQADNQEAEAGKANREPVDKSNGGQPKITLQSIRARQNDVANYVDSAAQGLMAPAPNLINGMVNPHAGMSQHDPGQIPASLQGLNPNQRTAVKQYGGNIAAANIDMPKEEAADIAARIVRIQSSKTPVTHVGPDGKRALDYVPDPKSGRAWIWVGNSYRPFYTKPNAIDEGPEPSPMSPSSGAGGGGGSEPPGATTDEVNND